MIAKFYSSQELIISQTLTLQVEELSIPTVTLGESELE